MAVSGKQPRVVISNLLVAIAISLVVNFSNFIYLLSLSPDTVPHRMTAVSAGWFMAIQVAYFTLMAFVLISICTNNRKNNDSKRFLIVILICIAVSVAFYFFTPKLRRGTELIFQFNSRRWLDPMLLLKCSLTLIVAVLYGKIFDLVYQKQHIELENEVLKNENLQATYNTLVNQINPHFFFNSLNSLSMLVREKHNDKALDYIDQLSDTFRYIIHNGHNGLTTLTEELAFLKSYTYLLEIRYEGKLFFNINVNSKYLDYLLPSLSIQPLIENAVKHNSITRSTPLTIVIATHESALSVSNSITSKIEQADGTGIGLSNLSERYRLITGKDIYIEDDGETFTVKLPLTEPESRK